LYAEAVGQAVAFGALLMTVALALTRPRVSARFRLTPAMAAGLGVTVLLAARVVGPSDLLDAASILWRPFLAIVAIMVTTSAAQEAGVFARIVSVIERHARGSALRTFNVVFVASAATAALLNNDSAVLLLTPLAVALARRLYPGRPRVVDAFAFAVFLSAGVAPLVISNPMNMIVAEYAGLDFNAYAVRMLPVWVAGRAVTLIVVNVLFARSLAPGPRASLPAVEAAKARAPIERKTHRAAVAVPVAMLAGLVAYPVIAYLGGPVWAVALGGAAAATATLWSFDGTPPERVLRGVSWDTLAFLWGVFVVAVGLKNAGLVGALAHIYASSAGAERIARIGAVSALGSAVLNNHPMAILNMMALKDVPGGARAPILAALIGGDLGPRLLPMGSLAGLLWLETLRKHDEHVSVVRFVAMGAAALIPSLVATLGVLALETWIEGR
jgi:arsenical pump membrane protein